jgi:chromatin segregation and condensation protein Rec8/ScpA/Scc1 (kleisin family)
MAKAPHAIVSSVTLSESDGDEALSEARGALSKGGKLDVLEMVKSPTWREVLVDLVVSRQMDPWSIDIAEVADSYFAKVRELRAHAKMLDLRFPANVILASAILLHFKASALLVEEEEEEQEQAPVEMIDEAIPQLVYKAQGPRTRRVTLDELVTALERVLREPEREIVRAKAQPLELQIPQQDMGTRMAEVYLKALAIKDEEGLLTFSQLANEGKEGPLEENILMAILPVLHLVQESKFAAWQEALFGDILIKVLPSQEPEGNGSAGALAAVRRQ